jgi:predicted amidophosphoribosyltransferase
MQSKERCAVRQRHFPRLCRACQAPMARQEDTCWRCGVQWGSEIRTRPALRVIHGGVENSGATQAELDATDDVVSALARWSAIRVQRRPAVAQEAT